MSAFLQNRRGSVAMETVMVLPLFVIILFLLFQLCLVWGAKQMVAYAAYCGARAALVYNPADYDAKQESDGHWQTASLEVGGSQTGVVHHAACTVLAWLSWSMTWDQNVPGYATDTGVVSNTSFINFVLGGKMEGVGRTEVPLSHFIRKQVRVEVREFEAIKEDDENDSGSSKADEPTPIERQFPAVTVRVRFEFPLFIPIGGTIMAYFFGAGETHVDTTGAIGSIGFTAPGGDIVQQYMEKTGRYTKLADGWGLYSIPLEESCTMAKPYKTDPFPVMSDDERGMMLLF